MPGIWIKWRHKFADGPGEWDWTECQDASYFTEAYLPQFQDEFSDSGHYRGVEWEEADPPDEVLKSKLFAVESTLRSLQEKRDRIRKILDYRKYPGTWFEKDRSSNWFTLEDESGNQITVMRYSGSCSVSFSGVVERKFTVPADLEDEGMALAAIAKWKELSNAG